MKLKWFWIVGALVVVGAGIWLITADRTESPTRGGGESRHSFRDAPAFKLSDAEGKAHSLADWRGEVVVLHFWAAWCPPCLDELPRWVAMAARYKGQKIRFVAVSLDEKWEDAHKILPSKGLAEGVISVIDPTIKVSESFGTYQFPETYLIGADQKILTKWVGPQDWESTQISEVIRGALSMASGTSGK